MKQEQKQDFTRRISQSNRSELIVVIYDIIFAYMEDAKACLNAEDDTGFKEALRKASGGIDELIQSLNFQYEISKNLYPLYIFAKESLAKALLKRSVKEIETAHEVLVNLYDAFLEVAKQDHSNPLMRNTQQVYAGFTYGRNHLTETFQEPENSRGFFA
ncbi:MAG: flagellar protein FliS [Eubacterium sp.]|jgi:flagellar protein FliS|nr:flagellar protein FliS [Eubacterium sp.]